MKPTLALVAWLWSSWALAVPFVQPNGPAVPILFNSSVTASGSQPVIGIISSEVDLIINVTGSPTGTLPTLTFTVAGSDPQSPGTAITGDVSVSTAALNATGTTVLTASPLRSSAVNISWTIGGSATPTFPGVYVTLVIKSVVSPGSNGIQVNGDGGFTGNVFIGGNLLVDGGTSLNTLNVAGQTNLASGNVVVNSSGIFTFSGSGINLNTTSTITSYGGPCSCTINTGTTCNCTTTGSTASSSCFFAIKGSSTIATAIGCECAATANTTTITCPTTTATFNAFTLN